MSKNNKNNYDTDTSDIDDEPERLLFRDEITNSEEILGPSFNVPHGEKRFIQGNRIHKELAAHQNLYKNLFYQHRANKVTAIKTAHNEYSKELVKLQEEQDEIASVLYFLFNGPIGKKFSGIIDKKNSILQDLKFSQKDEIISTNGKKVLYPNFATAQLSYVDKIEGKLHLHTKTIKKVKLSDDGHSEAQVFDYVRKILTSSGKNVQKYKSAHKIIVDIHTKMSMCYYGDDKDSCVKKADNLISDLNKIPELKGKIVIRVSYDFKYGYYEPEFDHCLPCGSRLIQHQIQFVENPAREILDLNSIIMSSGYGYYNSAIDQIRNEHYQHIQNVFDQRFAQQGRHIQAVNVEDDGNCFFHAIAKQLSLKNNNIKILTHEELRKFAIEYMKQHPQEFVGFVDVDEYIDEMSLDGSWADNPIIQALANEIGINIQIEHIDGTHTLITTNNNNASADPVVIAYTGAHYMSVEPIANTENEIDDLEEATTGLSLNDNKISGPSSEPSAMPSLAPSSVPTGIDYYSMNLESDSTMLGMMPPHSL